ncbi:MAG: NUDIX hydrolase [Aminivibrio sp.]|jgi:ADP-ribose pyrophosphatase
MDRTERPLSKSVKYRGSILNLRIDEVETPAGRHAVREVVEHAPAVAVLPVADDGAILLIRQYRYAVGRDMLEIPAGLVDPGESPERCAERELQEEIGYFPGKLQKIGTMYNSPGFCTETVTLYLGTELRPSRLAADEDEFIETVPVSGEEIRGMVERGEITDGKTFAALAWYLAFKK